MQHPATGRKFSIAAGQYTDEMECSESDGSAARQPPGRSEEAEGEARAEVAGMPATAKLEVASQVASPFQPSSQPEKPKAEKPKSQSDRWSEEISVLMLKGWKMLGENCPATGKVPLMQHPTNGRKFSVAANRYVDEMVVQADGDHETTTRTPNSSAIAQTPAPAPASANSPVPAPAPAPASMRSLAMAPTPTSSAALAPAPTRAPASNLSPSPAPPTSGMFASSAYTSAPPASNSTRNTLDSAADALCLQLSECTAILSRSEAPASQTVIETMAKCAEAIAAVERARSLMGRT